MAEQRRFSGVLLVDSRGWILLQERDEHPVIDPDCWGLVGGHVDPGEEFEAAAYRELAEETEVVVPPGGLHYFAVQVEVSPDALERAQHGPLLPGMAAEVYIKTHERTALEFLVEPLTAAMRRSFREH